MITLNSEQLLGKTTSHLAQNGAFAGVLHADVVEPFEALAEGAKIAGFDLRIISGYRSFSRQLGIWNAKASGARPVLNDESEEICLEELSPLERMHAILRWSALPGASRHHWGTDIDIYDAAAVDDNYQVQLTPEETIGSGPFAKMHAWLDDALPKTGFYRSYDEDRGGTGPERWHLSYAPIANTCAATQSPEALLSALADVEIELFDCISEHIDNIFQRYIQVPNGLID